MTSVREFLIIYGGLSHCRREEHYALWTFNTISGVWRRYEPPIGVKDTPVSSSICAVGNLVYIFGGTSFVDHFRMTNSIVSFDINNGVWEIIYPHAHMPDMNTPPPMCGNLLFYNDGSLYVLRGFANHIELDTLYKFNLKTFAWSLVPQYGVKPFLNNRIFGTVFKNSFYSFGDYLNKADRFRNVKIFDFWCYTWTTRYTNSKTQQYPEDRLLESFVFSSNHGYLGGGMHPDNNTLYSDIWKIDLESLDWSKLNHTYNIGVKNHQMSVVNDVHLFSFGGRGHDENCHNTLETFTIQTPKQYGMSIKFISISPGSIKQFKPLPDVILDYLNLNDNDISLDA